MFDSVNVTVLSAGNSYLFTGAPTSQTADTADNQYFEYSFDGGGNILLLDLPGTSLVGYAGGNLCSLGNLCNGLAGYFGVKVGPLLVNADPLATGSLAVATAATPEPSSLMLLGTGVLGIVGWPAAASRGASLRPIHCCKATSGTSSIKQLVNGRGARIREYFERTVTMNLSDLTRETAGPSSEGLFSAQRMLTGSVALTGYDVSGAVG